MERELEKDLKEIEYLIYVHKNRGNTNTQSILERVYEIIEPCAKTVRTLSELEELLSRENGKETTRFSRDNDVTEYCPHCDREITVSWNVEQDGYQIYCPNCGETIMLCSMCDREPCDWTENGCKYSDERYRDYFRKHMTDGWIPVDERVPKERVRPICLDFDDYLVTINFGFGARVKTLKYGDGHWWNGPSIVDEYVIAWRTNPEPYHPERSNDEKE